MSLDLSRAAFLHAHPDDETLATGALLAWLAASGADVAVVTATRGEEGELIPGVLDGASAAELVAYREQELAGALAVLGVRHHAFLGSPPARMDGLAPRRYTDSGMRWITPTVAGPGESAGSDSLTSASLLEAAADLAAYLRRHRATVLVSYDAHGGYGHPDHVACHRIAVQAAALTGVPFFEVVSPPPLPEPVEGSPASVEFTHPEHLATVQHALGCYASQLTVDGADVVHVGGQRQPILTSFWLRTP